MGNSGNGESIMRSTAYLVKTKDTTDRHDMSAKQAAHYTAGGYWRQTADERLGDSSPTGGSSSL